ncbi:hypothetical protein MNBD_ALPHA12-900 [hydrothermal vent metagenome]|uniref:Uncharacterized protein n=1 Tax=hydrothermal vent metagenome TaxID=652676 RepID=A0A3B0TVB6_9ZZZZ
MNLMRFTTISLMAAIAFPAAALAVNPEDFAAKLSETILAQSTLEISFDSALADGDTVILSGLKIPSLGESKAAEMLNRTLTFTGVSETADGGYQAKQASVDDIDFTRKGVNLTLQNIVFNNIRLPGDPANDTLGAMMIYQGMSAGPLAVNIAGSDVFKIDNIKTNTIVSSDQNLIEGSYAISGIYGDLSQVNDRDIKQLKEAFSISELTGRMDGAFSWNLGDGTLALNEASVSLDKIGKINLTLDLSGYTLALVKQLQEANKSLAKLDPDSSEYQARSLQMLMGAVTQLSFDSFGLRFDDASISDKVLNMLTKEKGMSRQDMIAAANAMLPAVMADVASPVFIKQVVGAVSSFLENPQSIEVTARPNAPLPFLTIMAAAKDPSAVLDMLNVSVEANQEAK